MSSSQCIFLGSGASLGVPLVACKCEVCLSTNPFNKRLRPSVLLKVAGKQLVIDCGPDFRQQALLHKIDRLDGLLLTHAHYDHVEGIDELRAYIHDDSKGIPCLLSRATADDIRHRFHYIFSGKNSAPVQLHELTDERGHCQFQDLPWHFFSYEQAGCPVTGFRIGDFAYASDLKKFPETIFEDLAGVQTLVISALRHTKSVLHLSVDEAIAFAQRVGAQQTYFTHLSHAIDYEKTEAVLPRNIHLAYDGLAINFNL